MPTFLTKEELEKRIADLPGDKVTKEYIESRIVAREFIRPNRLLGGTLTLCTITVDNGFIVVGQSACVDPANYNQEIGDTLAYNHAFSQLWPLFGFALADTRLAISKLDK